jgi:AraC-like DNA-binding protein
MRASTTVANALGYTDADSFRRAHRRWIGAAPSRALGVRQVQHDAGVIDLE